MRGGQAFQPARNLAQAHAREAEQAQCRRILGLLLGQRGENFRREAVSRRRGDGFVDAMTVR
jgi:hypothetical protein